MRAPGQGGCAAHAYTITTPNFPTKSPITVSQLVHTIDLQFSPQISQVRPISCFPHGRPHQPPFPWVFRAFSSRGGNIDSELASASSEAGESLLTLTFKAHGASHPGVISVRLRDSATFCPARSRVSDSGDG